MLISDHRTKAIKIGTIGAAVALLLLSTLGRFFITMPPTPPGEGLDLSGAEQALILIVNAGIWGSALFSAWKLKTVSVEGTMLVLGGIRREIEVPLHQVAAVDQPWWMGRLARIELHGETDFGDTIWFLSVRAHQGLLGPASGVQELRRLLGGAQGGRSVAPPPVSVDYTAAWRRLRRWRVVQILCFATFLIGGPMVLALTAGSPGALLFIIPIMLGVMISGIAISGWACPQCGQRFFTSSWGIPLPSIFIRRCGHCGLPKGQTHPSLPTGAKS